MFIKLTTVNLQTREPSDSYFDSEKIIAWNDVEGQRGERYTQVMTMTGSAFCMKEGFDVVTRKMELAGAKFLTEDKKAIVQ